MVIAAVCCFDHYNHLLRKMLVTGIWEDFLKIVKNDVGSRVVETWFKSITLCKWDQPSKTVYLRAPNVFVRDWVKDNYTFMIQTHLGRLLHVTDPHLVFLEQEAFDTANEIGARAMTVVPSSVIKKESKKVLAAPSLSLIPASLIKSDDRSNGIYSFNNFVVGPSNSLAYAAAHAITEKPGDLYNPLFIYGRSGLGKTHLLHSIGNGLRENNKKAVVLYQTTDKFVNEFINAIRFNKVHNFNAKYKQVDALLIDDVQFISNKEQTQEAFFHIFNVLYESRKQIVLSSDTVPQQIQGLAERLQSRLGGGLVADIHTPSLETKIAIIKKKAELSNNGFLMDEVAQFIAKTTVSNIRELEGALIRVTAFAALTQQAITLELAKQVLLSVIEPAEKESVDFHDVLRCMQNYYPCTLDQLCSKSRNKQLSFVRQVAMFLFKTVANKSLREIGEYLGGRDHSTVMHAVNKIKQYAATQEDFHQILKKIEHESFR